ncbi:MAG: DUF2332 domain-containing protein [Acidimicrobiia bacterium]|nr:DUF2332 domain-containing protein [Acidimicrobiia bacterium]
MPDGAPGAPPAAAMDAAGCARMFREFAATAASRAPLYARLAAGIAEDHALAGRLLIAPVSQRQPVLLFACVHAVLLDDPSVALARHFPNLTPAPDPGDPLPAWRDLCRSRSVELDHLLATRTTQTNEVGRCALLLPAFGVLAAEVGPLAHLDVGASAGLNLLLSRFRYRYEPGGDVGPAGAPVTLTCGVRGPVPLPCSMPMIAAAVGVDPAPIDVGNDDEARWLEACVWPDQTDRFSRLGAAITLARSVGVDVRRGDAVTDAPRLAVELAARGHPVVTNTWVLNYLTTPQRRAYVDALDDVGARVDLSWVYAESPPLVEGIPTPPAAGEERALEGRIESGTVLTMVRWRSGRRRVEHLAQCHPHGYWLHWQ